MGKNVALDICCTDAYLATRHFISVRKVECRDSLEHAAPQLADEQAQTAVTVYAGYMLKYCLA